MNATITLTDYTAAAQSLLTLLGKGSQTGYTVAPAAGSGELQTPGQCVYLSIQSSPSNGATVVYKGDSSTANDGSRQAKELLAGDVDVMQAAPYVVHLGEVFIRASANNAKVNVEVRYQ